MDIICLILGICCLIFRTNALAIVTMVISFLEIFLLILVGAKTKTDPNENIIAYIVSLASLAFGIVCLCV